MFQKILVPLDGSPRAERAIPVAARLAKASGSMVVLLRVVGLPSTFMPYPTAEPLTIQSIADADEASAKDYLENLAHSDRLKNIKIETEVTVGTAATTILSVAEAGHFDLIIMCSHGYTGMKRWLLGSVAEHVGRHASVPLLLLRDGGPALAGTPPQAEGPLGSLIPLDGSARAETAILPAIQLSSAMAFPGPAELHLMRVIPQLEPKESGRRKWEPLLREAKRYLSATTEHLRVEVAQDSLSTSKFAITWSVICDDDIAAGILRVAETGEATERDGVSGISGVIAIATHGYSGIQRWAMGSITERVLHASQLPLLIVRPVDMRDQNRQAQEHKSLATVSQ